MTAKTVLSPEATATWNRLWDEARAEYGRRAKSMTNANLLAARAKAAQSLTANPDSPVASGALVGLTDEACNRGLF